MQSSSDVHAYWAQNALRHIRPERNGAEFPEGQKAIDVIGGLLGDARFYDYGCGRGRWAPLFPPEQYCGLDISDQALKRARIASPGHTFMRPDEAREERDFVLAYTVLLHIPDDGLPGLVPRLFELAPVVVVAEIMDPAMRQDRVLPYALNRSAQEYIDLFSACGGELESEQSAPYDAYAGTRLTVLCFRSIAS